MEIKDKLLDIEDVKKSKIPLLNLFIRKTAVITATSESLVEKIIKDQWENANKQTKEGSEIAEIDFPNMGVFFVSEKKSKNRIKSILNHNDILNKEVSDESSTDKEKAKALGILDKNRVAVQNIKLKNKFKDGI